MLPGVLDQVEDEISELLAGQFRGLGAAGRADENYQVVLTSKIPMVTTAIYVARGMLRSGSLALLAVEGRRIRSRRSW